MPTKLTSKTIESGPLPPIIETLRDRLGELPEKDRPFAYSLLGAAAGRGLSDKQAMWVRKLAGRIVAPEPAPEPLDLGDVSTIATLFATAQASGLRWPRLRTVTADGTVLTLRVAGDKSSHVGQIMVTTGQRENRLYYGRVDGAGCFHPSKQPTEKALREAGEALAALARDPAKAGAAYGMRTGSCAFCALPLDDGRSVEVGYGPVCAEKWGLPWGVESKPKRRVRAGAK